MKKTTVTTYECELCGRESDDEAEAMECEERCTKMKRQLQILYPVGTFLIRNGYLSVVTGDPRGEPQGEWSISLNIIQSVHDRNYLFSSWDKDETKRAMSELTVLSHDEVLDRLRPRKT